MRKRKSMEMTWRKNVKQREKEDGLVFPSHRPASSASEGLWNTGVLQSWRKLPVCVLKMHFNEAGGDSCSGTVGACVSHAPRTEWARVFGCWCFLIPVWFWWCLFYFFFFMFSVEFWTSAEICTSLTKCFKVCWCLSDWDSKSAPVDVYFCSMRQLHSAPQG